MAITTVSVSAYRWSFKLERKDKNGAALPVKELIFLPVPLFSNHTWGRIRKKVKPAI
jgi:hypothetical protein